LRPRPEQSCVPDEQAGQHDPGSREVMRYTVVWVAVALFMAACAPPAAVSNDPATSKQVVERLGLLNQLLAAKDKGIVNEFETDALLLGSEENEIAIGR